MSNTPTPNHAAREAGQLPNYRLYDRTGGGVTHDICAESLDDAIEQGRAWIEDGDWRGGEQDGTYRSLPLDCCVREIVRVPDLRSIETALPQYPIERDGDTIYVDHHTSDGETPADIAYQLRDVAAVSALHERGEDGCMRVILLPVTVLPTMIDEDATAHGDSYDCSGTYAPDEPKCDAPDGEEHDWTSDDGAPVGGISENPGVWSLGGTRMSFRACCRHCGRYRNETDPGCQRNPDEATLTVTIEDADEASKKWIEQNSAN